MHDTVPLFFLIFCVFRKLLYHCLTLVLFLTFSVSVTKTRKNNFKCDQSRLWSTEQNENNRKIKYGQYSCLDRLVIDRSIDR